MSYKAAIRNNATGETRVYTLEGCDWHGDFIWTEGNFACDCNRSIFFDSAGGIDTDAEDDEGTDLRPCGHERFYVPYVELPDGTRIKIDDEPDPGPSKE